MERKGMGIDYMGIGENANVKLHSRSFLILMSGLYSVDTALICANYWLPICVAIFAESRSNPHEGSLRRHLFDREYQTEDLLTTPIADIQQIMNISFSIYIIKLIALVKTESFLNPVYTMQPVV